MAGEVRLDLNGKNYYLFWCCLIEDIKQSVVLIDIRLYDEGTIKRCKELFHN